MRVVKVGFLGFGNIGSGVYQVLRDNADLIEHRDGLHFEVKRMLVRDVNKSRKFMVGTKLTTDVADIAGDPEIEFVCEFMGGIHPAREYILEVLKAGKTVITANKQVLANCWPELQAAAQESGAGLYFEASVAGGIPIIRTMWDSIQANHIDSIMGIINGTTNYILTRMTEEGLSYEEVLESAQKLGLAEPDPTSDVEGYDAMYKLSILGSMGFHTRLPIDVIYHEGITKVTKEDIAYGKEMGYTLKLLAIGKKRGNEVEARVHPAFIPNTHPLASIRGAFNAVFMHGDAVGDLMLYGRGAGDLPTASAIISDLVYACHQDKHRYMTFKNQPFLDPGTTILEDWESEYYLHVKVVDKPGVLAKMTQIFADHEVSVASVFQKNTEAKEGSASVVFVTHKTRELAMKSVLKDLEAEADVLEIKNCIRVEEGEQDA